MELLAIRLSAIKHALSRWLCALLLARIYDVLPLVCPKCGGEMKIIAFLTEAVVIREILGHLGESTSPPRLLPTRGPPLWEMAGIEPGEIDPRVLPAPDYEFDQRVAWKGKTSKTCHRSSRGSSCLWSRERRISAAYVTPDTHNGQAGAGFEVLRL